MLKKTKRRDSLLKFFSHNVIGGGWGTFLYGLYRFLRLQREGFPAVFIIYRVWFLHCSHELGISLLEEVRLFQVMNKELRKIALVGHKEGEGFGNKAAHPSSIFWEYPSEAGVTILYFIIVRIRINMY